MTGRLPRAIGVGASAVLCLSLAACGGGDASERAGSGAASPGAPATSLPPPPTPEAHVAQALAKAETVTSVSLVESATVEGKTSTTRVVTTSSRPFRAHIVSDERPRGGPLIEQVLAGGFVYTRGAKPSGPLARLSRKVSKPWIKLRDNAYLNDYAVPFATLGPVYGATSKETLETIQLATAIRRVDSERLRAVDTTHYSAVVDFAAAAKRTTGRQRQLAQSYGEVQIKSITIDLWISAEGLVRRAQTKRPASKVTGGASTVVVDVIAYDVPVQITLPPAALVHDGTRDG
jgi:hypothetical protein